MKFFHYCSVLFISYLLVSCAIQVPPGGGDKDIKPPGLLSSEPANHSTLFTGRDIRLNFDEYIALNDLNSQLIVSPLLKYSPEIKIRKKSVLIHLQDTLLDNTTYTMNFGQGITDNNEGNKLENFQYVFSTGSIIDSLSISGKIENAFDRKTEKNLMAMLYRKVDDSLPYLERPLYFARTLDSGFFQISNISPGSYKIIGLKDNDGDYIYSQGADMIGFRDSLVIAQTENVKLELFRELPRLRLLRSYSEFPGKAVLVFNAPADTIKWKWLCDTTKLDMFSINYSADLDSINFWYKNDFADSLSLCFDYPFLKDTVILRLFKKTEESSGRRKPSMTVSAGKGQTTLQHLYRPFYLESNRPLIKAEFQKIIFKEDSIIVKPEIEYSDSLHMHMNLKYSWKNRKNYSLFIPPLTFTDIYGATNDTVQIDFITHGENDYGSVKVKFQKSNPFPYILQLTNDAGSMTFAEVRMYNDSVVEFNNLDPGIYRIKLITDRNNNGKWDTGNYLSHVQPEETEFYPEAITVRANWDVEVIVKPPFSNIKK